MITTLGMALKLHRTRAGLKQIEVGRLLGKSTQRLIHLWESGRVIPKAAYQEKIKNFLATDPLVLKSTAHAAGLIKPRKKWGHSKLRRPRYV